LLTKREGDQIKGNDKVRGKPKRAGWEKKSRGIKALRYEL
jgi:hypothetical protein